MKVRICKLGAMRRTEIHWRALVSRNYLCGNPMGICGVYPGGAFVTGLKAADISPGKSWCYLDYLDLSDK